MNNLIVESLTKKYGKTVILDHLSLEVGPGLVSLLLGRNGAGKTTFFKSLIGLVSAGSKMSFKGRAINQDQLSLSTFYHPHSLAFYPDTVAKDYFNLFSPPASRDKAMFDSNYKEFKLHEIFSKKIGQLSQGQKQRLNLALMFSTEKEVYLLDEPFTGLDPVWLGIFKENIKKLKNKNKIIIISSHLLGEMQGIADNYLLLKDGKILHSGELNKSAEQTIIQQLEG